MKKKILITLGISFFIVLTTTLAFLNVYGGTPEVKEGEVLITLADENLYDGIINNLEDQNIKFNNCGGFNSYKNNKGYIILRDEEIDKIKELNLYAYYISDLSGIQKFTSLKKLNISDNNLSNIDTIKNTNLKNTIESLNINNNKLDNNQILELECIVNLKELYISGLNFSNNSTNLNFLNSIVGLKALDISNNSFNSLENLNVGNLEFLNISNNEIEDISLLKNNNKINTLVLNYNKLDDEDVEDLVTIINLKALGIAGNNITKLGNIKNLTNLEELTISENTCSNFDLKGIENLNNLKILFAGYLGINNLNNIKNVDGLEILDISGNNIENVEDIIYLNELEYLDISANKIRNISNQALEFLNNLSEVNYKNQIFEDSAEGIRGQTVEISLPEIFKKAETIAQEEDNEYSEEKYFLLTNCTFNENKTKVIVDPYLAATLGASIEITDGIFMNTNFEIYGTSMIYEFDRTNNNNEENERVEELKKALKIQNLSDFDMKKLSDFYEENENNLSEEESQIVAEYMDFNTDGNIDEKDYNRLDNYINGEIDFLYTVETIENIPTNENIIAEVITSDYRVNLDVDRGIRKISENGIVTLYYTKNDVEKQLSSYISFIDKTCPTYYGPSYSANSNSVTVTIRSYEDLNDIYSKAENTSEDEELTNQTDEGGNENTQNDEVINLSKWVLSEDKRTITKVFNSNEDEVVIIQDIAGNITEISVNVNNLPINEAESSSLIICKYNNSYGKNYKPNSWTNQDIYLNINKNTAETIKYTVNDGEEKLNETLLTEEGEYSIKVYKKENNKEYLINSFMVKIDKTAPQAGNIEIFENNRDGKKLENGSITNEFIYIFLDNQNPIDDNADKTVYTINGGKEIDISTIIENNGVYNIQVITYDRAGNKTLGNKYTIREN